MKRISILDRFSLRTKLIGLFMFAFILPLIIFSALLFSNVQNILQRKTIEYELNILNRIEINVEQYFDSLISKAQAITNDAKITSILERQEKDYSNKIEFIKDNEFIFGIISNVLIQNTEIKSVYIYTEKKPNYYVNFEDTIDYSFNPSQLDWYNEILRNSQLSVTLPQQVDMQTTHKQQLVIPVAFPVKSNQAGLDQASDNIGLMLLNIDPQALISLCNFSGGENSQVYLVDQAGELICSTDQSPGADKVIDSIWSPMQNSSAGSFIYEQEENSQLVNYKRSGTNGMSLIIMSNNRQLSSDITNISIYFIIFILLIISIFVILSNLIARSISLPIKKLEKILVGVQSNQLQGKIAINDGQPSYLLSEHINNLVNTINNLFDRIEKHHQVEKLQERNILEAQINPHFIYNTLNAIRWIASMQQAHEVADGIKSLINLLQSSIKIGQPFIPIKDEIAQIKDYVRLQQLRYADSFEVDYKISETVEKYKTIKFVLQPIIENSIFHGLNHEEKNGKITIQIDKRLEEIVYTIQDNGRGMSEETISQLLKAETSEAGFNGIGLRNVNERIKNYFGEQYGLSVSSEISQGTTITIEIPAILFEGE